MCSSIWCNGCNTEDVVGYRVVDVRMRPDACIIADVVMRVVGRGVTNVW